MVSRVWVAAGLLVVWMGITFLLIPAQDGNVSLDALVTQGFGRQFVVACLFLIAAAIVLRWGTLALAAAAGRTVFLGWLHAIVIAIFWSLLCHRGFPIPLSWPLSWRTR